MSQRIIRKWMFPCVLCFSMVIAFFPTSTYAIGWSYKLDEYERWGSSSCATSYPKVRFTVKQSSGESYAKVEKLSGGSWVTVSSKRGLWGAETTSWTIPRDSSSTKYRVYLHSGAFGNAIGTVSCKGSY
ncbi:hypothetical protein RYX51_22555 (plasmid) [Priestia filamentosa]|nr:hypothetical protein RYX51_22555 [Priestia filamentosa]